MPCICCRTKIAYYLKQPCDRTIKLAFDFREAVDGQEAGYVDKYHLRTKTSELNGNFLVELTRFRLKVARYFEQGTFTKLLGEDETDDMSDEGILFQFNHDHRRHFASLGKHLKLVRGAQLEFLAKFDPSKIGDEDMRWDLLISEPTQAEMKADPDCRGCYSVDYYSITGELHSLVAEVDAIQTECWEEFGIDTLEFDPTNGWEMLCLVGRVQEDKTLPPEYPPEQENNTLGRNEVDAAEEGGEEGGPMDGGDDNEELNEMEDQEDPEN